MTDDTTSPAQGAQHPEPPQASLRAELAGQIAAAQSELQSQLVELQSASGDSSLTSELQGQLHVLSALDQFLSSANGPSLSQIRAELARSVAAVRSIAQQAQTTIAAAHASEAAKQAAEYAAATAELDRKVADTFAIDRDNNALAHAMAKRFGIDLSETDVEREKLEAEKRAAIARGDKLAERELDVRLAENTLQALDTASAPVTEPGERNAVEKAMSAQRQVLETRTAALKSQRELVKTQGAASVGVTNSYDTAQSASDFSLSLDGPSAIALSTAPDAHTNVEAPQLAVTTGAKTQGRA